MNAIQITSGFAQTEIEPGATDARAVTPKPLPVALRRIAPRRMLLLGILLLSAWMGVATLASLKQINLQLDDIRTSLVAPFR